MISLGLERLSNTKVTQKFRVCSCTCILVGRSVWFVWVGWVMVVLIPREGSNLILLQDSYDNSSELPFQCCSSYPGQCGETMIEAFLLEA